MIRTDPHGRNIAFLDRSRYFSSKQLLNCAHEVEWTRLQTAENRTLHKHCCENLKSITK
jgi:hypothetical protein